MDKYFSAMHFEIYIHWTEVAFRVDGPFLKWTPLSETTPTAGKRHFLVNAIPLSAFSIRKTLAAPRSKQNLKWNPSQNISSRNVFFVCLFFNFKKVRWRGMGWDLAFHSKEWGVSAGNGLLPQLSLPPTISSNWAGGTSIVEHWYALMMIPQFQQSGRNGVFADIPLHVGIIDSVPPSG